MMCAQYAIRLRQTHGNKISRSALVHGIGQGGIGIYAKLGGTLKWMQKKQGNRCSPVYASTADGTGGTIRHSTKLSKNDNLVAGYNPAKDAGLLIGYAYASTAQKKYLEQCIRG